jgi:phage shock protein E
MLNTFKSLLGFGPDADYSELVKDGATILDVRSKGEYANGHIKGSINISVDTLQVNLGKLNKSKPVITCCASGMRSASAKIYCWQMGLRKCITVALGIVCKVK